MTAVAGTAGGANSAPQFSIRGQSQQERGGLADPSVGVYFGDVVIARTHGLNQGLFDINDVEVIRRSEERRVGKELVSTRRSRWSPEHLKKNITIPYNTTP